MGPFCGPIIAQIFPKMHGLEYIKLSKIFGVVIPIVEEGDPAAPTPVRHPQLNTNRRPHMQIDNNKTNETRQL